MDTKLVLTFWQGPKLYLENAGQNWPGTYQHMADFLASLS
jgi:hypothetical protein